MLGEYQTSSGARFSFSGWAAGESPLECFDRRDWLDCLHGCMFCAGFHPDPRVLLEDDGVLHELVHLAGGVDICTHSNLAALRNSVLALQLLVKRSTYAN